MTKPIIKSNDTTVTTLATAVEGRLYKVINIRLSAAEKQKLEMLGLTCGTGLFLCRRLKDTLIIRFRNSRFAIGEKYAKGIIIGEKASEFYSGRQSELRQNHTF